MSNTYQLVLIDGSNNLFRAYHALPKLVSTKGQPTVATTVEPRRTHLQPCPSQAHSLHDLFPVPITVRV